MSEWKVKFSVRAKKRDTNAASPAGNFIMSPAGDAAFE
jgi:hypothetical protein